MKTRPETDDGIDTLMHADELPALRVPWRIPVPPTHEQGVIAALTELQGACAQTSRSLVAAQRRQHFEAERVLPAYRRVQQELDWMLGAWKLTLQLPEFAGGQRTAGRVQALLRQMARSFESDCSLLEAVRASCLLWVLRRIGVELLPHLWADESFSWWSRLGPQCYPSSREFPSGIWDIAFGRANGDTVLIRQLAELRADDGVVVRDPAWAELALRGEYEETFLGQLPVLPVAAWASAHGWPDRLWERTEAAGLGCGPWIVAEERQLPAGDVGDDGFEPFDDVE